MGSTNSTKYIYSEALPDSESSGFSPIYRNETIYFTPDSTSYIELFLQTSYKYPARQFLGIQKPDRYKWLTYEKTRQKLHKYIAFLQKFSLQKNELGLTLIGILCKSSPEWLIFDMACMSLTYTTVGLHDHRDFSESLWIMNKIKLSTLCCTSENVLKVLLSKKEGNLPDLTTIIVIGRLSNEEKQLGENLVTMKYLKLAKNIEVCVNFPESDSVYSLGITSGTTGEPKIVMITHRNLMASVIGAAANGYDFSQNDIYFSYIPLSVAVERSAVYTLSKFGTKIGMSSGEITNISKEMQILKPTIILSVPDMLEDIYSLINLEFGKKIGLQRMLLNKAIKSKKKNYEKDGSVIHKIYNSFIFKKVRERLGGKLRLIIVGVSHISPDVVKMLRIYLSCAVIEGYGTVESNTMNFCSMYGDNTDGHQGSPMRTIEAKLMLVPELAGFYEGPVGELFLRGECVCSQYADGSDVVDNQGWLKTGDIFTVLPSNQAFSFIDRKENLIEIQGNIIAIGKIEAIYRISNFISQIFISKNIHEELIAFVVPNEKFVIEICDNNYAKYSEMLQSETLLQMIRSNFEDIAEKFKF